MRALTLRRKYEECQKNEGKIVSNYDTTLKTQYEGYFSAAPLRLVLIVALQRWEEGKAVRECQWVVEWVVVKAGTSSTLSQLSCAGGRGERW